MSDDAKKPLSAEDERIEREIRAGRKFTLAEAIGRAAGDLMKGVSPVSKKRQAELEVGHYLKEHLQDSDGALRRVLLRRVVDSETLLTSGYELPFAALCRVTEALLASEERLRRFVHEVDREWGRLFSERPHFESPGRPPHAEDPYTFTSVRAALTRLAEGLRTGPADQRRDGSA